MSPHQTQDLLLYLPFLAGQLLYILKRAGFSMRAGRAPSRWKYICQNWDILLFRSVLEFIFIFVPVRHFTPDQLLSFFHIDLSGIEALNFLQNPVSSPVSLLFAGIAADGVMDWLVDWASRSDNKRIPGIFKKWLSENVSQLNGKNHTNPPQV